jgi:hypothetical protein
LEDAWGHSEPCTCSCSLQLLTWPSLVTLASVPAHTFSMDCCPCPTEHTCSYQLQDHYRFAISGHVHFLHPVLHFSMFANSLGLSTCQHEPLEGVAIGIQTKVAYHVYTTTENVRRRCWPLWGRHLTRRCSIWRITIVCGYTALSFELSTTLQYISVGTRAAHT